MDLSQAAYGLDMRAASRIYFISPVLNPQVEAQAIGRARRISQKKPVTVVTLVLRDSIDEVIMERKKNMSQAEHRKCKSILDDRPIYNWILNAKITSMSEEQPDGPSQMTPLETPQFVFGRASRRVMHPDEALLLDGPSDVLHGEPNGGSPTLAVRGKKRLHDSAIGDSTAGPSENLPENRKRRVRFASDSDDDDGFANTAASS
jgi:hypothetical protein